MADNVPARPSRDLEPALDSIQIVLSDRYASSRTPAAVAAAEHDDDHRLVVVRADRSRSEPGG
jgi:hypothetical protein